MKAKHIPIAILALIFCISSCATAPLSDYSKVEGNYLVKGVEIKTRPNISQSFILIKPAKPIASVILFAGSTGKLDLHISKGDLRIDTRMRDIFLVRSRKEFAKQNFMVAVMDAPSDKQGMLGMHSDSFRCSDDHWKDVKAIINYLKALENVPIWLVGTSMGTLSAAYVASRLKDGIDGLILTSSITRSLPVIYGTYLDGVVSLNLNKVSVPTLIVAHKNDGCIYSPVSGAARIKQKLLNSPNVEIKYYTGGLKPISRPCAGLSPHGFYGIEKKVVKHIADFIKSNITKK